MKSMVATAIGLLLFSGLACAAASPQAQGTSTINGTVKDSSGAVLPGVGVTATQTATNIRRETVSDERGNFVLPNLPVGPYKVEAVLPGFRTFVQTGIELGVNQNPNLSIALEVGQVSQEVEVQANVTMVETRNLGVRQVIENQEVLDLPLQSRNATDLLTLLGGAVGSAFRALFPRSLRLLDGSGDFGTPGIVNASWVNSSASWLFPVISLRAPNRFRCSISKNSSNEGRGAISASSPRADTAAGAARSAATDQAPATLGDPPSSIVMT